MPESSGRNEVAKHLDLAEIRYSMVWEDHALLESGLRIEPDDHLLAIVSGGNNVLAMLLREPRKITAVDMSPAQIALFDLKLRGIEHLGHEAFLELLGYRGPGTTHAAYAKVRPHLADASAEFWDGHHETIDDGIYRCGRLETYFGAFVRDHLREVWPKDLVQRLFAPQTLEAQAELFEREAFTPEFQRRFAQYFGRESMAKRGRDPSQFKYVEDGDVGEFFLKRFHWVCTSLPLRGNFYVERFLTGGHADLELGPEYLRRANFEKLKTLIDRVDVVEAELETILDQAAPGTFQKAMLSDVFEYMSEDDATALFSQLATALSPGGRVAYWNLLVPRQPPESMWPRLQPLTSESGALHRRDRSWFYRSFHIDEVQS